ncbi:MAG: hypothetical protein JW990_07925 [Thermoleophilia bacterium]|nr:hypothetical protein [Thermoleophilia bacterium]
MLRAVIDGGLDLQIREDYLDIYHRGLAVLKLARHRRPPEYRATIHHKFLKGVSLPARCSTGSSKYTTFSATDAFVADYMAHLPQVLENAREYSSPEAEVEERMIQDSYTAPSPVVFIDRQVQVHGVRKKADLLGVNRLTGAAVLTELKRDLDARIQHLMSQIADYHAVLVGRDGRLRREVADSYRLVTRQKKLLGLLPDAALLSDEAPVVECLLVLHRYNLKSKLLGRLKDSAQQSPLKTKLVLLPKDQYVLPPPEQWERL